MSEVRIDPGWRRALQRRLLGWFRRHARDLPWRRTRDPYCVWVSEIMLQQTQVATVIPYFERFIAAFPNVHALAGAPEQRVLRLWEGLGYYRRARELHRAARIIRDEHQGSFPTDPAVVRTLPGIGRYTAGAILSIAFDSRQPIVEANTGRLFSRLSTFRGDIRSGVGREHLWQFATDILPRHGAGTFNQALMELGATVCVLRAPRCGSCPVAQLCPTHAAGLQEVIPLPAPKTNYEASREICAVVWKRGRVLLRRCADGERWAGMWDFPRFAATPRPSGDQRPQLASGLYALTGISIQSAGHLVTLKHGVTRFRITLDCYQGDWCAGKVHRGTARWVRPGALGQYPLSMTARKIASLLQLPTQ